MAGKIFFLDTSVLVHDPNAIERFGDNELVIPLCVLEELDGLKRDPDEVGRNAREVLRAIDSSRRKEGSRLKIHLQSSNKDPVTFPLPLNHSSNRLLFEAHCLQEEGKVVVVISKDFVTRVKAEALGIEAEDYENLKTSYREMYRGIQEIQVTQKEIDGFYKEGSLPPSAALLRPNEYVLLQANETRSSVLCKHNSRHKKLESLLSTPKEIWGIRPLNTEQRCAIDLLLRDEIHLVTLIGQAGTGKTLLALACGMQKVFDDHVYNRILISRPIVPLGKDIGYLPGTKEEKLYHWMQPIYDNLEFLCTTTSGEGNGPAAMSFILESKKIEMEAVTYIRGRSLPKMYMIIDEAQNLTPHEVKTIVSRAGKGTKVVLTGDPSQIDNPYLDQDSNGLTYAVSRFKNHKIFGHILLEKTERSQLASVAAELL